MQNWTRRKGIMLAYPMEEKRFHKWGSFAICQPKLDGERCRAIITDNKVMLLSSEENVIWSVPHINKELEEMKLGMIELDGELYSHNISFEEIHSRIGRTVNLHEDHKEISYYVFDVVEDDILQKHRSMQLIELAKVYSTKANHIKFVTSGFVKSLDDIDRFLDIYIDNGYEGIILRHPNFPYLRRRSTGMMKFKPSKQDSYLIVGYNEEIDKDGNPKGTLGSLLCYSNGCTFSVGSGLTREQRVNLWAEKKSLLGNMAVVKYQHKTSAGAPRFPVLIEILP